VGTRFGESRFKSSGLITSRREALMTENYRHHYVQIVFVGGSPEPLRRQPPPAYKRNQWSPWRPADKPPRLSKAEASKRLFDAINQQEQAVREFMSEARRRTA
jgi:hypothetical protein